MKHRLSISVLLGLLLAAVWVVRDYQKSPATVVRDCVPAGRIISIQGEVQLKRQEWKSYRPTAIGALLCAGDLLFPSKGAVVVVHCNDPSQNLWTATPGVPSGAGTGCRPTTRATYTITKPLAPPRNPYTQSIPYIIGV